MRNISYFRSNKYGNKSSKCLYQHYHASIFEAEYCNKLAMLLKAGEIKAFDTQIPYELKIGKEKICSHVVDFVVTTNEGAIEVHETKGFQTDVWILKYKLFKALYPDIPYHIITKDYRYAVRRKNNSSFLRSRRKYR